MRLGRGLCALVVWLAPAAAQHYSFRVFDRDSGLANLEIQCLYQDRTGFLWACTTNGLFRYEGGRFSRFGTAEGLPGNTVESVQESADGTLWVTTQTGLARFNGSRFESMDLGKGVRFYGMSAIAAFQDTVYVGSSTGVFRLRREGDRWRAETAAGSGVAVTAVLARAGGELWYSCRNKLCVAAGGRTVELGPPQGVPEARWMALGETPDGGVYARSSSHLIVFAGGRYQERPRQMTLPASEYRAGRLVFDRWGHWLAPTMEGLAIGKRGEWKRFGLREGLIADRVSCVLEDREGTVWIGTPGFGLLRWSGYGLWENWGQMEGLESESMWGLAYDRQGTLWAGTSRGPHRFLKGRWQRWPEAGIPTSEVISLAFGGDGTLWVGSYPHGLYRVDPVRGKVLARYAEGVFDMPWITGLLVDREDWLWVSTYAGLFRTRASGPAGAFERMMPASWAPKESVYAVRQDGAGRIWVPSTQGLAAYYRGTWRVINQHHGLKPMPRHVAVAPDGAVWIGYAEPVGLSRLEWDGGTPRVTHIDSQHGLASNMVMSLGFDRTGALWAGTDNGVMVRTTGGEWLHFGQAHGLAWNDTNFTSLLPGPGDDMWIGTNRGLSHFMGLKRLRTAAPPRVMITGVRFGPEARKLPDNPEVPYADRALHVTFTALTFEDEQEVQFRYRVAGLETQWTTTSHREVRVPHLTAGDYRFEVLARSARGVWSPRPATYAFRVLPPWYLHPATLTAATVVLVLSIWVFNRWRVRRLLRQRRRLEEKVKERTAELNVAWRKAEESSRLKTEFLARMSHEIRTPLHAILASTQLARDGSAGEEARENLDSVTDSAQTLLTLLTDLLDVSRLEAGKLALSDEVFPLRDNVELAARVGALQARHKGLRFEMDFHLEAHTAVRGDALRLRQILQNLLSNAVKFTAHGEVRLAVNGGPGEPGWLNVTFEISDTGIGIPPGKLDVIREPFRQGDASSTRAYGGTGLGLAIADRLTAMMNGKMEIESEAGKGSRFRVTIPLRMAPPLEAAPATGLVENPVRSCAVLLAEDNPVNRRLVTKILTKRGHAVITADNGEAALAEYGRRPFDVVLMDVDMPVMDGIEATARIREQERATGRRVPVIALTANAMTGDRERCIEAGMDEFITKPFTAAQLCQAVESRVTAEVRP